MLLERVKETNITAAELLDNRNACAGRRTVVGLRGGRSASDDRHEKNTDEDRPKYVCGLYC